MARPRETGLEYFPVDVTWPTDKKIEGLIGRMGTQAAFVYHCILCVIYQDHGYYTDWDEDNLLRVSRMA